MAAGYGASGNAANASVVIVKVLLGMVVRVAPVGFDSWHVIGRIRLVQFGRRSQDVGVGSRNDRGSRRIERSTRGFWEKLHTVDRVADIGRTGAADGAGFGGRAERRTAVVLGGTHGRHSLLVVLRVNSAVERLLRPRSMRKANDGDSGKKKHKIWGKSQQANEGHRLCDVRSWLLGNLSRGKQGVE